MISAGHDMKSGSTVFLVLLALLSMEVMSETSVQMFHDASATPGFYKANIPFTDDQLSEKFYADAITALGSGDVKAAESKLKIALSHNAGNVPAMELLATLYAKGNRTAAAIALLNKSYLQGRAQMSSVLMLSRLYSDRDNVASAIAVLERHGDHADAGRDSSWQYYAMLAVLYQRDDQYERAVSIYRRLVNRQPGNVAWWTGLGLSLEASGKPEDALLVYRQAESVGDDNAVLSDYLQARIALLDKSLKMAAPDVPFDEEF